MSFRGLFSKDAVAVSITVALAGIFLCGKGKSLYFPAECLVITRGKQHSPRDYL